MSEARRAPGAGGKQGLLGTLGTLLLVGVALLAHGLGLLPTSEMGAPNAHGGAEELDDREAPEAVDLSSLRIGTRFESSLPTLERTPLDRLGQAIRNREKRVWMTLEGRVVQVLPDDLEGSRHQRFLFDVAPGIPTLKLSHNIDLAPPVPMAEGDRFAARGRYEWNEFGGVIHWTHHDPDREIEGGWVEFRGERYE